MLAAEVELELPSQQPSSLKAGEEEAEEPGFVASSTQQTWELPKPSLVVPEERLVPLVLRARSAVMAVSGATRPLVPT